MNRKQLKSLGYCILIVPSFVTLGIGLVMDTWRAIAAIVLAGIVLGGLAVGVKRSNLL